MSQLVTKFVTNRLLSYCSIPEQAVIAQLGISAKKRRKFGDNPKIPRDQERHCGISFLSLTFWATPFSTLGILASTARNFGNKP